MNIERDSTRKSNAIAEYSATLFLMMACVVTIFSLYLVWLLQWQGPFRDLWEFIPELEQQLLGHWSLAYLTDAYGGAHRILLPKLVFFADWRWFGGENTLTIFLSIACQIIYLTLISQTLSKETVLSKSGKKVIFAAFLLALFSTTQVNNFLYAMDVQWFMSNLLGLLAFTALISNQPKMVCFLLLGTCAALCNFTGLMSLIAGTVWLSTQRLFNRSYWLLVLMTCVISALYIHNPQTADNFILVSLQQNNSILSFGKTLLITMVNMAIYLLRYLSSPLSREWPWCGSLLSAFILLVIFYYWKRCRSNTLSQWQHLCLLIASYILFSAIATAFGRILYPNSAVAERYQTLILPLLPAMIGLLLPDFRSHKWHHAVMLSLGLVMGIVLLPSQISSAKDMAILSNRVNLAHTAARAGVLDHPYIGATLSHPLLVNNINMVKIVDPFLRSHQLGYFHALQTFRLDQDWHLPTTSALTDTLPACANNVQLHFDSEKKVWTVQGHLLTNKTEPASDFIIVHQEKIIGFGLPVRPEGNLLPFSQMPAELQQFRAFVLESRIQHNNPFYIYGLTDGQAVCRQQALVF